MLDKMPNIFEQTILKNKFAKEIYEDYLLEKVKDFGLPAKAKGELANILQINTAVGKGGAAKVAHDFLNIELNKRGLNSKLLVGMDYLKTYDIVSELKNPNIVLHKTLHKASRNLGWLDFFNPACFNIPNLEVFKDADVIHLHNLHGAYFSPFLLPELTSLKPVVWTLHDEQAYTGHCSFAFECEKWKQECGNCPRLGYYPKLKKDMTKFLLDTKKKIYDNSHFTVVCPSEWSKNRVQQSILGNKDIRVIHNGINTEVFSPIDKNKARKLLNLPLDKKILMFSASGSLNNLQKGGEFILQAYEALKNNPEILFINIGGNTDKQRANWIDVPYVKQEEKMKLYYSAADLFIYPSLAETFGLVIAESMSCQIPVIAFKDTPASEMIKHMQTGYLANYKDLEDFLAGIKIFSEDSELAKHAGIQARQDIEASFSLDKMINNYINLYKEILM